MAWNLKGSYMETCSCDFICPCYASFDHGATYDYCRVTLVFNIHEGDIEGTDIGGLKVAAIADTPKVITDGNWKLGLRRDGRYYPAAVETAITRFLEACSVEFRFVEAPESRRETRTSDLQRKC